MYKKIVKVDNPQIFFKHEIDALSDKYKANVTNYFTFLDENDKLADNVLYIPYELHNNRYWGDTICVMKRCEEERYSQKIIDSCHKDYKKRGIKQYEWYLTKKPSVINVISGECVFIAENEMDYVYVYGNLIYWSSRFGVNKKILDRHGMVLADNIKDIFDTKTHLIVHTNHDYRTHLDEVICINKLTGNIDNKF